MRRIARFVWSFLFIVLTVFPLHAFAQVEAAIRGTVVARADRSVLSGAAIQLEGATLLERMEVRAADDGYFGIQRLTPGDYLLTVSHDGFLEERRRLSLKPREVQNITIELSLRPIEQIVDVPADADSIPTIHSPSSSLLDSRRMETLPMPQRSNLPDMIITAAPGMIRGHDDFVHIRGNEIALNPFINGVSFWENPHSLFSTGLGVIGIGAAVTRRPLPHHRAYGSVHGGSRRLG